MKNEGNEGMLKRVSVDFCFVRSTKLENVGAILVIAMYSVFALLFMRQFVNCLYVVSDYRAAGIAVNMPILAHIHYNQYLRRFRTFAQYICKYC